jgi:membrane associated rhomboid family serine protease
VAGGWKRQLMISISYIIIGITVLISWVAFSSPTLMQGMMMNPYLITTRQQYYRFLTSGFIHRDFTHLFFNMFSFYFFGTIIERDFQYLFGGLGGVYFIALYCLAIVVSDLPTYFKQRHNPAYNSLGASGGVAAIIFAFIVFRPLEKIYLFLAIGIPGFILGIAYIGYSYYQGRNTNDSINHDAHLYGALFGLLFCVVMYPAAIPNFFEQIRHWSLLKDLF